MILLRQCRNRILLNHLLSFVVRFHSIWILGTLCLFLSRVKSRIITIQSCLPCKDLMICLIMITISMLDSTGYECVINQLCSDNWVWIWSYLNGIYKYSTRSFLVNKLLIMGFYTFWSCHVLIIGSRHLAIWVIRTSAYPAILELMIWVYRPLAQ